MKSHTFSLKSVIDLMPDMPFPHSEVSLVFAFGILEMLEDSRLLQRLRFTFPNAIIAGCSAAGEVVNDQALQGTVAIAAICLEKTKLRSFLLPTPPEQSHREIGKSLAQSLADPELAGVVIFSDGLTTDCDALLDGIREIIPNTTISGGLAADGYNFENTAVINNDGVYPESVLAIGFYGSHFHMRSHAESGWKTANRLVQVTKSSDNIAYEFDHRPALDVLIEHMGAEAVNLPAAAVYYPACLTHHDGTPSLVRVPISIDEEKRSILYGGTVPQGSMNLMALANTRDLVEGAATAARNALPTQIDDLAACFALVISCSARRVVMGPAIAKEIDAAMHHLGIHTPSVGFYSYGEICHSHITQRCELHNLTMTITTFVES